MHQYDRIRFPTTETDTTLLILASAGVLNEEYLKLIEQLMNAPVQIRKRLLGKRPRRTDVERARLTRRADQLERKVLETAETIITPATLRQWYKTFNSEEQIGEAGFAHPQKQRDASCSWQERIQVGVKMPKQIGSKTWASKSTIVPSGEHGRVMEYPLRERQANDNQERFLTTNWPDLAAIDSILESAGLVGRYHAWYAIHLDTREVQLVDLFSHPTGDGTTN